MKFDELDWIIKKPKSSQFNSVQYVNGRTELDDRSYTCKMIIMTILEPLTLCLQNKTWNYTESFVAVPLSTGIEPWCLGALVPWSHGTNSRFLAESKKG
jgi:hypothetical protein